MSTAKNRKFLKLYLNKIIVLIGVVSGLFAIRTEFYNGWILWGVGVINGTSLYENEKYSIKLEYPKNWDKKEPETPDVITREIVKFTQASSENNSTVPTISIVVRPVNNEQDTLEKLIKSETDEIDKSSIIKRGRPRIGDQEAYNLIYTRVDENLVTIEYLKAFFKTNKSVYVITYSSNKVDFDKSSKVVDNMIKSIKVGKLSKS